MRIALYGGTFDPIHHGHLILAREARETLGLDRVVFIPAAVSPHKLHTSPTPSAIRWEMVRLSVEDEPGFAADDLELHRTGPSFTYDTVCEYRRRFPEAELFYFIGSDNLNALPTWYRIEELLKIVTLVVLARGSEEGGDSHLRIERRLDLSATEIRNRVAKGQSVRYLVPQRVDDLIREKKLYLESPH